MFFNYKLAIDISDTEIKIIYGNKKVVKAFKILKTPEYSVVDGSIVDIDAVKELIQEFITNKGIKPKEVLFSLQGQDIVVRQIEIPIISKKDIRSTVEWEIGQYLPDGGNNHYIDFQLIEKVENEEKKVLKLLVVAALKDKVHKVVELADLLNLKVASIDFSANSIARVFSMEKNNPKDNGTFVVIRLEDKKSSIIIIEKGSLFMEREVPFGLENVIREVSKRLDKNYDDSQEYLKNQFSFRSIGPGDEVAIRIQTLYDNVFQSFAKVIQFYTTGRINKTIDRVYIIGGGCELSGLSDYVKSYFNSPTYIIGFHKKLPFNVRTPKGLDVKQFISNIGLLLRKE